MMSDENDFPGGDAASGEADDELDRHRQELFERITQFMEDEDLNEAAASFLLLDLALTLRMAAYGTGVKNPSAAGLKLDLDRLQREVGDFIRLAKKGAEEFIRNTKEMLATVEEEEEEDEPGGE